MPVVDEFELIASRFEFLNLVRDGVTHLNAALAVGWTPHRLKKEMQDDEFIEAVETAEQSRDETIETVLYRRAVGGNLKAIELWLYNRRPDLWKDRTALKVQTNVTLIAPHVAAATRDIAREVLMSGLGPEAIAALQRGDVIETHAAEG